MSRVHVKWYGDRLTRAVKRHMLRNLRDAAVFYRSEVIRLIATPGPPRSAPYEPPNWEFANLMASYVIEYDDSIMTARIGSGMIPTKGRYAPYARYLEYGVKRNAPDEIAPRPHIRPALYNNWDKIGRIATQPMS